MNAIIVYLPRGDKKVIIPSGRRYSINSKGSLRWPTPSTTSPPPFCGKRLNLGGLGKKKGEGEIVGWIRQNANYAIISLVRRRGGLRRPFWKWNFWGRRRYINIRGLVSACLRNNRCLDAIRSSGILISRRGRIGFRSRIRSSSFRCCLGWNILNLEGKLIVVDGYSSLTCVKNVVECKKQFISFGNCHF